MDIIINHLDIQLFNCAIGSRAGRLCLYSPKSIDSTLYHKFNAGMSSAVKGKLEEDDRGIEVECLTLDDFFHEEEIKFTKPILLKIDVEGSELEVLRGMTKLLKQTSVPIFIVTELNFSQGSLYSDVVHFLSDLGYQIHNLKLMPIQANSQLLDGDYVFIKR
jgi:FkbM family methyltransferase